MEVHAHTHTARKKWTHYLWEFLMLFLAVFCGFLTENLREHRVERQRGRQYIQSFYQDLKVDTGRFTTLIKSFEERSAAFKNMHECFNKLINGDQTDTCLLDLFFHSFWGKSLRIHPIPQCCTFSASIWVRNRFPQFRNSFKMQIPFDSGILGIDSAAESHPGIPKFI